MTYCDILCEPSIRLKLTIIVSHVNLASNQQFVNNRISQPQKTRLLQYQYKTGQDKNKKLINSNKSGIFIHNNSFNWLPRIHAMVIKNQHIERLFNWNEQRHGQEECHDKYTNEIIKKLRASEIVVLRKMFWISWTEKCWGFCEQRSILILWAENNDDDIVIREEFWEEHWWYQGQARMLIGQRRTLIGQRRMLRISWT